MEQPKPNLKIISDKKNARMILPNMLTLIGVCIGFVLSYLWQFRLYEPKRIYHEGTIESSYDAFIESLVKSGEFVLGDIIICPEVVNKESNIYSISKENRWAHMIIHSMLHLQGYTHDLSQHRVIMENKEKELMNTLGYSDPYYAN